jgi:hypothetical protein
MNAFIDKQYKKINFTRFTLFMIYYICLTSFKYAVFESYSIYISLKELITKFTTFIFQQLLFIYCNYKFSKLSYKLENKYLVGQK